jgi:hypothetical protein
MRYKVWQLQNVRNEMDCITKVITRYDLEMNVIGKYEGTNKSPHIEDSIWNMCNVTEWDDNYKEGNPIHENGITLYPTKFFKGFASSDVVVETRNNLYVALPFGWEKVKSLHEAFKIIMQNGKYKWNNVKNKEEILFRTILNC